MVDPDVGLVGPPREIDVIDESIPSLFEFGMHRRNRLVGVVWGNSTIRSAGMATRFR